MQIPATTPTNERLEAFAANWAELFCRDYPDKKPAFIGHFLTRADVNRFWMASAMIGDEKIAVCRLGDDVMLAFSGGKIHALDISREKVSGITLPEMPAGPTKRMARFLRYIQIKINARATTEHKRFYSLTSFSRQASEQVSKTLRADLLPDLRAYPSAQKNRYAGYYSVRFKRYIGHYGIALKRFLAEVDQVRLFAIRSVRCPSITLYNWLATGDQERRLQALKASPVLVPLEVLIGREKHPKVGQELTSLIDKGDPFYPCLAAAHQTTVATIKKISRLSPYLIGSAPYFLEHGIDRHRFRPVIFGTDLGNKRPRTKKGWQACTEALYATQMNISESILSGMPAWQSDEWTQLLPQLRNLRDLGFAGRIILERSMREALRFSEQWHEKRNEVQANVLTLHGIKESYTWPGMLKSNVEHAPTGLIFYEVVDDVALAMEGDFMGHCVGDYANRCFEGLSRIISIRKNDRSLATLEYRLHIPAGGRKSYQCVQAYGPGNTAISDKDIQAAMSWFSKRLRTFVRTYEREVVPLSMRPIAKHSLQGLVKEEMADWIDGKLAKLGLLKEYKEAEVATRARLEYEEEHGW